MPDAPEDEAIRLRRELTRVTDALVAQERESHRLRCEYRRIAEELDWRDEKIRVLQRVILRLGAKENP